MNELASDTKQALMPRPLRVAVAILVLQSLGNGVLGLLIVDNLDRITRHGGAPSEAGLAYLAGYAGMAIALVLLVCVVFTLRPRVWVRPVVATVEVITIIGGLVTVFSGTVTGALAVLLAFTVIRVLMTDDVQAWYAQGSIWR
ncbi:hypothetical protein [Kutzneria sp. NPDC052558]|uniref:hypothetical protein n=1 Tax=Kutzneria sp. NPDC052558 TaxID=3364121 RepID=UPI0037CB54D3